MSLMIASRMRGSADGPTIVGRCPTPTFGDTAAQVARRADRSARGGGGPRGGGGRVAASPGRGPDRARERQRGGLLQPGRDRAGARLPLGPEAPVRGWAGGTGGADR